MTEDEKQEAMSEMSYDLAMELQSAATAWVNNNATRLKEAGCDGMDVADIFSDAAGGNAGAIAAHTMSNIDDATNVIIDDMSEYLAKAFKARFVEMMRNGRDNANQPNAESTHVIQ